MISGPSGTIYAIDFVRKMQGKSQAALIEASDHEQYVVKCRRKGGRLFAVLDSKAFKHLVPFLAILWGGSLLLPTVGQLQPVAAGVVLVVTFIAIRIKRRRGHSHRR